MIRKSGRPENSSENTRNSVHSVKFKFLLMFVRRKCFLLTLFSLFVQFSGGVAPQVQEPPCLIIKLKRLRTPQQFFFDANLARGFKKERKEKRKSLLRTNMLGKGYFFYRQPHI